MNLGFKSSFHNLLEYSFLICKLSDEEDATSGWWVLTNYCFSCKFRKCLTYLIHKLSDEDYTTMGSLLFYKE
jgi:hypothetical protein